MGKGDSGPDFSLERAAIAHGRTAVAGVDEAGRGPWAGPVVAAAVVLVEDRIPDGLNDSKKLSAGKRDRLFDEIMVRADVGVGIIDAADIDQCNILRATMRAMSESVQRLSVTPDHVLIDGNRMPDLPCPGETIVKGDGRSLSIAAASIIAKVTRDRIMEDMDESYPGYDFARHKGYGTAVHQAALKALGPCPIHRYSFAPIRALAEARGR